MQLYIKAAANPFIIVFSLAIMLMLVFAFALDPYPVGSEDYIGMLVAIQMGKIGGFFITMFGNLKLHQNKFYASCCCGKALYTVIPTLTGLGVSLFYDMILSIIAVINLGIAGLSDIMVVNSVSSALLIFVAACYGKKELTLWVMIPYMLFMFSPGLFGKTGILDGISGMPVGVSAVIAVSIYVISVVLSLVIVNTWWKKHDKFTVPNQFVTHAMGGQ